MKNQQCICLFKPALAALALASLAACGGDSGSNTPVPEELRAQDSRTFTPAPETTFAALANTLVDTDR